jgi:hypothetical protein
MILDVALHKVTISGEQDGLTRDDCVVLNGGPSHLSTHSTQHQPKGGIWCHVAAHREDTVFLRTTSPPTPDCESDFGWEIAHAAVFLLH